MNNVIQGYKPFTLAMPMKGQRALPFVFDLTTTNAIEIDLQKELALGQIDLIQSVWVDNSDNEAPFSLTMLGSEPPQRLLVPAGGQGLFPLFGPAGLPRMLAQSTGEVGVSVIFLNVPLPYYASGASGGGDACCPEELALLTQINGKLSNTNGSAYADRSGTITAGGVSQQIMAANLDRKKFFVQAPFTNQENLYLNFTAAAGTTGDSVEILPGGSYFENTPCTPEAINIIGATMGTSFIAKEM